MDISFTISGAIVAGGVTWAAKEVYVSVRNWVRAVNEHLVNCAKKESGEAALAVKVEEIGEWVKNVEQRVVSNHNVILEHLIQLSGGQKAPLPTKENQ